MPSLLVDTLSSCFGTDLFPSSRDDPLLWQHNLSSGSVSMAVVQANETVEDQSEVRAGPHGICFGVYDGHGGPEASRFVSSNLISHIQKFAQEQGGISAETIRKGFSATEEGFLKLVQKNWQILPQLITTGSCCLLGVLSGSMLYVANLGDSRAVLGSAVKGAQGVVAKRLSKEHNASIEEIQRELRAEHPDDPQIVVLKKGVWRVKGIIQITRSIGDIYMKKPEYKSNATIAPFTKPILTACPSINEFTISTDDRFLIFASDGLWEHLSDQEAVNIVHRYPSKGIAKRLVQEALKVAASKREMRHSDLKLLRRGVRRLFHDDISVIVVFLNRYQPRERGQCSFDNVKAPVDVHNCRR